MLTEIPVTCTSTYLCDHQGATRVVRVTKLIEDFDVTELSPDEAFGSAVADGVLEVICDSMSRLEYKRKVFFAAHAQNGMCSRTCERYCWYLYASCRL